MFIQIILIVFFLVAIVKVVHRYQAGDVTKMEALFWVVLWILAGAVVARPDATFYFARAVGVGRGADLVVYIALAGLFFMVFRLMVKIERLSKALTKTVRRDALADTQPKEQKK